MPPVASSSRRRASPWYLHLESRDGLDVQMRWATRRGLVGTYVTGAGTENAVDANGTTYAAAYQHPRATFDLANGTWAHSGRLLDGSLGDLYSVAYPLTPRAMTVYLRFRRSAAYSANAVLFGIGGTTGARFLLTEDAGGYTATYHHGTTAYTSSVVTGQWPDEWVELRATMGATGVVTLYVTRSGSDETAGAASADPGSLAAAWNATTAYVAANAGPTVSAVHSYDVVIVGPGALAITAFRPPWWASTWVASVARLAEDGTPRLAEDGTVRMTEGY